MGGRIAWCLVWLLVGIGWPVVGFAQQESQVSFNRDVLPILSDKCFHCHGRDAANQSSEFRLDTRENAIADLGGYVGVKPGDLAASELHARIHSEGDDRMPPREAVRQLTEKEKQLLDQWIESGAAYETHWAFATLPESVPVPAKGKGWAKNDIDRFVAAKIEAAGLRPNVEASKETWLRRVTFDLTGLPPTTTEIDAFLADDSADAYEEVVDQLLTRPACAERLAAEWLDVARYADSYGYQVDSERFVWPWRDWVIEAFQRNQPYDEFITWQLAGDLLPEATQEQRLATTFNRLHSHKKEGGVAVEEFRVENVADRAHTVATALMGLTFECARCHDHKYDPITTKDYYRFSSFFANIDERGLISYFTDAVPTPSMPLVTDEEQQELDKAQGEIAAAEHRLKQIESDAESDFASWLASEPKISEIRGKVSHLSFDAPEQVDSAEKPTTLTIADQVRPDAPASTSAANLLMPGKVGTAIKLTGDDAVEIPTVGQFSRDQPFSIALWIQPSEVTERAVIYRHSRGWDDAGSIGYELTKLGSKLSAKLVHFWPGNAICVETVDVLQPGQWCHVLVTYDGSSKAAGLRIYLNGEPAKTEVVKDHLTRQITRWGGGENNLAIGSRYRDRGFKGGLVDEFQVFDRQLSSLEVRHVYDGADLEQAVVAALQVASRNSMDELRDYYLLAVHEPSRQARSELQQARQRWNKLMDATPAIMVMRELEQPLPAYVLVRGGYDNRGEEVQADTPSFLPAFPADLSRNRLGLAKWLTSDDHPLMARVTVNRYWQLMFGMGLVRTPEDFGAQGERPTHEKLLDWLARDFIEHDWDVHRLLKQMALSATYRQSAVVSKEVRMADPENRLLARSFHRQLSAEMLRDNVLAVSGLLANDVGGPPAKPYDLSLSYKPTTPATGAGLYRRSVYTFWQRTSPAPVMTTLNAGKREVCRVRREEVPSPLQALVMLNGTQFVEASRVFAGHLLKKHQEDDQALIEEAFRCLTSRRPTEGQLEVLQALYDEQRVFYTAQPAEADSLLAIGDAGNEPDLSPARHAAATVLVNAIMNLDQCVRLQ
ncbi:DUF1553 domain-containing protein [Aeoliella mucimassa]|uniref:Planctomycete cytochrome C n=1 Tax=Aeoliella mucimassa TaxID=2527972 RepID=A0A518AQF9_9BACT|nr:DUF1553 domain-containing protein [Aeoliella mucimassa]QDU56959.1 Planctomycete cytochrome C [Aeoliella mucimassa]